jgi:uncharacterized membrane-anchored protein
MQTAFFLVLRAVAVLLVLVVVLVAGAIAVSAFYQPVDGVVFLVMLGVLGGVVFLIWIAFKSRRRLRAAGVGTSSGPSG